MAADLKAELRGIARGFDRADKAARPGGEKAASQDQQPLTPDPPLPAPTGWADPPLPAPSRRRGSGLHQFAVQVPARHFEMLKAAAATGMSASLLVVSALDAHGAGLHSHAQRAGLVLPKEPGRPVTVRLRDVELAELDELAAAVAPALGRRSRSATVVLLFDRCDHPN